MTDGMPRKLRHSELVASRLPDPDEDLDGFGKTWRFALTFNGYGWAGGTEGLVIVADALKRRLDAGHDLREVGLPLLRAALFWEQRQWRMAVQDLRAGAPDPYATMPWMRAYPQDVTYVRALLSAIRNRLQPSGGSQ